VIRLIVGVVLCMAAVDADHAPLSLVAPIALIGLTLAATGARKLWSTAK